MADTPETPDETTPDAEPEAPVTPEDADGGVEEGAGPGSPASPAPGGRGGGVGGAPRPPPPPPPGGGRPPGAPPPPRGGPAAAPKGGEAPPPQSQPRLERGRDAEDARGAPGRARPPA